MDQWIKISQLNFNSKVLLTKISSFWSKMTFSARFSIQQLQKIKNNEIWLIFGYFLLKILHYSSVLVIFEMKIFKNLGLIEIQYPIFSRKFSKFVSFAAHFINSFDIQ